MNLRLLWLVFMCIVTSANAQNTELKETLKEMKAAFSVPADGHVVPLVKQGDVAYQVALGEGKKKLQVRFSFFPISFFEKQGTPKNMDQTVALFFGTIVMNIAQGEKNVKMISDLEKKIYAGVYNADKGYGALIKGRESDFARKYDFVFVQGFFKKNRGLVVVSALFDDMSVLNDEDISTSFHFE